MLQDPQKQKLVMQIMSLAYAVHENTSYCVFICFSGHVDDLEIDIRESKERWQNKVCKAERYTAYKHYRNKGEMYADLKSIRDVLKEILQTNDIPYTSMERQVTTVYNNYF
jgi:radical SAM superfamily enzyme